MLKTFICQHCGEMFNKNPRLKAQQQHYCGSKECQQARKNRWETERLKSSPEYKKKRAESKRRWYKNKPGDKYQREYRNAHSDYCDGNRKKQLSRKQKRITVSTRSKIVKTDALTKESLAIKELYVLLPYDKSKHEEIVNTDALIVQLLSISGTSPDLVLDSS